MIDPHKWLFAPLDCSALLYKEPAHARAAFTQHADYIAAFQEIGDWNPGDYGIHLTRRARGVPFWFMLATYGTDAVTEAVRCSLDLAKETARLIERWPDLSLLMEPELSVVVFTREGWTMTDYRAWSDRLLADGIAFVLPTSGQRRVGPPLLLRQPTHDDRGRRADPDTLMVVADSFR